MEGSSNVHGKFYREVEALGLHQPKPNDAIVTEADIAPLPRTVQRYFRFMGAIDKPRIWSLHVAFRGRFKRSRNSGWAECQTIQYNSKDELARVFYLKLRVAGVPMVGRDTYLRGKGRMVGRVLDWIKVVDGSGPEFDIGELVTYLNDAILFAPSMLLGRESEWTEVDDRSFDVALTDQGTTVRARVLLDDRGAPVDFSTTDRFVEESGKYVRAEWRTPMEGYIETEGRRFPASGKAVWHFKDAPPLEYADFRVDPELVAFNLLPGKPPSR